MRTFSTRRLFGIALLAVGMGLVTASLPGDSGVLRASPQTGSVTPGPAATAGVSAERLRVYYDQLEVAVRALPARATVADVMRPLLMSAGAEPGQTGITGENRAALYVVAFYVNGWPLGALVPEARSWPAIPRHPVVLLGRGDLAQHFTVSALLAAVAGAPMANLIGVYKEVRDASDREGFSFCDLAADRAGTMFGQLATSSPQSANRLLDRIGAGLTEADVMPDIIGLPEDLTQAQLQERFGGVGGQAYNAVLADIDRRVAALRLFR